MRGILGLRRRGKFEVGVLAEWFCDFDWCLVKHFGNARACFAGQRDMEGIRPICRFLERRGALFESEAVNEIQTPRMSGLLPAISLYTERGQFCSLNHSATIKTRNRRYSRHRARNPCMRCMVCSCRWRSRPGALRCHAQICLVCSSLVDF